jgi:non-ribosomal peptide synthetase component F
MPTSKGGFIGLQEEQYPFDKPIHSQYDLTLKMNANLSKTVAWIEYNRELFESNSMVRMIGHFISLIDNVINDILDFRIFKMLGQLATFPC